MAFIAFWDLAPNASLASFIDGFFLSFDSLQAFPEHAGRLSHTSVPFWEEIHQGGKTGAELIRTSESSEASLGIWIALGLADIKEGADFFGLLGWVIEHVANLETNKTTYVTFTHPQPQSEPCKPGAGTSDKIGPEKERDGFGGKHSTWGKSNRNCT